MTTSSDLESRLARVEASLDRVVALLEQKSPFDAASHQAQQALQSIYGDREVQERMAELVLRMGEPETLEALTRIGVLLPQLEYALQAAAGGPELLEEALEAVRHELDRSGTDAADVQQRTQAALDAAIALSRPEVLRGLTQIAGSLQGTQPIISALASAGEDVAAHEGSAAMQERLHETLVLLIQPETLDSLGRIAALAPQIEYAVNALAAGPELLEEGMELAQERLQQEGLDHAAVQTRLDAGLDAAKALSTPESLRALSRIGRATPALAPLVDAAARTGRMLIEHEGEGAFTDRLAESLLRIIEPETLDALTRVAALTPQIEYAVNALAAGPEVLEEALETVRKTSAEHGMTPGDVEARARRALEVAVTLTDPSVMNRIQHLDVAGLVELSEKVTEASNREALMKLVDLAPTLERPLSALPVQTHTLEILRTLNEAVEELSNEPPRVGMFGVLGALGDARVQRALGFGLAVARRLGEHLEQKRLPAPR